MKSTGIVRKTDELGKIAIPSGLRKVLGIEKNDYLEIYSEDNEIIFRKYIPEMACAITGEISSENKKFREGNLILSPKGIELLLKELELLNN
ncbi:transition state regulator Abh [Peribacillus simplex]|uniref:AbrB/MazE/SpoVT family DNA-binding domain-containing protein n=1 Tax=Peribacillus simplex TaxID=1478 RepID=UPI003D2A1FE4